MHQDRNCLSEKLTLREDQLDIIKEIGQHLTAKEDRILVYAPTGSGKTFTLAQLINQYLSASKHLFIVNRDALILQAYNEFKQAGLESGVYAGEYSSLLNKTLPIQIASAQTINARGMEWFEADFVHLDECHLTAYCAISQGYFDKLNNVIIGWTATPERLARDEELGDKFNVMVKGLMPWQMIELGLLKKPIYYSLSKKIQYNVKHQNTIAVAINEYQRLAANRQVICFTQDVEQAHEIAHQFNERGMPFAAIDSTMKPAYRQTMYNSLEAGEIVGLSSFDALSEGFNVKRVSCIILMRDTDSASKYFQQKGRGLRQFPGIDDCIILDMVGLSSDNRFGTIQDILDVSLKTSFSKQVGNFPKKVCPSCDAVLAAFEKQCPQCKYRFPIKEMPPLSLEEKLLQKIPAKDRAAVLSARTLRKKAYFEGGSLVSTTQILGNSNGKIIEPQYLRGAIFGNKATVLEESKFLTYLQSVAVNEGKSQDWVRSEFSKEFGLTTK
ncbi:DEAD/DEAH box helicase (plasmid) [Nostoc sp. C052]|uniref:DEAD/DEAH box helicase n=1 Tax=Nostoc sp. C052 TaxID=2576902 RepID=UPI0015C33185|nr:DEAD/DEAH box helicase family protein [Nostoc sp. C052]QLE46513.1 DEAD/DEAH box helicase [Nostoc sp. C052]